MFLTLVFILVITFLMRHENVKMGAFFVMLEVNAVLSLMYGLDAHDNSSVCSHGIIMMHNQGIASQLCQL